MRSLVMKSFGWNSGKVDRTITKWICENPECRSSFAEYINGCPKCSDRGLSFSVRAKEFVLFDGDGSGYSSRLSFRLLFEPRDIWVGVYWTHGQMGEWFAYICALPCLPLRVHYQKSFGGIFPEAINYPIKS